MAITVTRQPPPSGPAAIMRALSDLNPPTGRLGGAQVDISAPLGLYRLGLDDIEAENSFDRAELAGWRYLLEGGGQSVGAADVIVAENGQARFASLSRNEQADFLLQAAHIAEHVAEELTDDCEARILVIPSLYISALWLTSSPPVFIPFLDAARPIHHAEEVSVRPNFAADLIMRAEAARGRRPSPESGVPIP